MASLTCSYNVTRGVAIRQDRSFTLSKIVGRSEARARAKWAAVVVVCGFVFPARVVGFGTGSVPCTTRQWPDSPIEDQMRGHPAVWHGA